MLEWLKSMWAKYKVHVSVVGGALVVASIYGQCTFEPDVEAIEDAVEEAADEAATNTTDDVPTTVPAAHTEEEGTVEDATTANTEDVNIENTENAGVNTNTNAEAAENQ